MLLFLSPGHVFARDTGEGTWATVGWLMGHCRGSSWATAGAAHGPLQGSSISSAHGPGVSPLSRSEVAACLCREAGVTGLDLQANNPTPSHAAMQSGDTGGRHGHHSLLKLGDLNSKYKK